MHEKKAFTFQYDKGQAYSYKSRHIAEEGLQESGRFVNLLLQENEFEFLKKADYKSTLFGRFNHLINEMVASGKSHAHKNNTIWDMV